MLKELKENGEIILEGLRRMKELSISDIVRDLGFKRCGVRITIAYLLGRNKIKERPAGMAKLYRLK